MHICTHCYRLPLVPDSDKFNCHRNLNLWQLYEDGFIVKKGKQAPLVLKLASGSIFCIIRTRLTSVR